MAENPEIHEETVLSSDLSGAIRAFIRSQWRVLHRVPAHVRRDKKYVYEPAMVPLGPYHSKEHPQSHLVEPLKNQLLDMDCMGADHKSFLLSMISERIDEIRHFYGGADGYDDKELAEMMLRDACFVKFYMKPQLTQFVLVRHCLGMGGDLFMAKEKKSRSRTTWQMINNSFRSATDLKAKGVHFRRSSNCLTDIKFFSFAFYAELHLPFFYITYNSMVFFSNAIALEMSPEAGYSTYGMTTYFTFMKTLIHNVNDIKVLREKGVLYSLLATDEEVVALFKSIDTFGFAIEDYFTDVKERIEDHCNSKCRTWMAELINTKFKSPWTVMALAAASFLLCLTFLQTYYTINPATN